MPKIKDVCRHVRSKNAGPFYVTIDFFFKSQEEFDRYAESPALAPALFAELYGTNPNLVKRVAVRSLAVLKVSYARPQPQGWMGERDMHQGQSYARLLDVSLPEPA
jgi:hypothetical protein